MNESTSPSNDEQPSLQPERQVMQATAIYDLTAYQTDGEPAADRKPPTFLPPVLTWPCMKIAGMVEWLFGVISMIAILTLCAAIPILQFVTLGYLLEISSQIVKQRKVRAGFVGIRKAARIGGFALGTLIVWLPAFNVSDIFRDAKILLGNSQDIRPFSINLVVVLLLTVAYTLWAWLRGGKLRHFLWPAPVRFFKSILKRQTYQEAVAGFWKFTDSLQIGPMFMLGLRGFLGAGMWLLLPVLLCIGGTQLPEGLRGLSTLLGLPSLAFVLCYLPILQTRFAVGRDWKVFYEIGEVRALFKRAPIALWISMLSVWGFALPVYLAKIQLTPREVFLLPTVIFVIFAWPSRMLLGWAYARATKRETDRNVISIWLSRLAIVPVVMIYAGVVFLSRYTSWYGDWSLFEQHALLIPIPLLGG